ncbi:hypothetical protein [Kitasatospora aureofaciens]|uniref:hypothetical protein n=1 Tax=Kitasatospora aureofaciens TaxID=1894 RepID=UPI0034113A5D
MTAVALIGRADGAISQVRSRSTAQAQSIWQTLPDYSDEGLALWLDQIIPLVTATQQTIATLTDLYLSGVLSRLSGQDVSPVGISPETVSGAGVRNGTPPEVEYERPFKEIWYQLSQDKEFAEAVAIGEQRAMSMISTDFQLARTHAARSVLTEAAPKLGIVGYRRVLTSGRSCDLCSIAATQRYHVNDLMPIHNNCRCGVSPIMAEKDPGQVIDRGYIHDGEVTDRTSGGLPYFGFATTHDSPLEVRMHGEIGPVLTVRGQAFRGPSDIPTAAETAA